MIYALPNVQVRALHATPQTPALGDVVARAMAPPGRGGKRRHGMSTAAANLPRGRTNTSRLATRLYNCARVPTLRDVRYHPVATR